MWKIAKFEDFKAALSFVWFCYQNWAPAVPLGSSVYYLGWMEE
jgi:hypothetical protein